MRLVSPAEEVEGEVPGVGAGILVLSLGYAARYLPLLGHSSV